MTAAQTPPDVEVRRSRRRRRTATAYREDGRTIVLLPSHVAKRDEPALVADLLARLERLEGRRRASDAALMARARRLIELYLPEAPRPATVRWVANQRQRWGSCTVDDRTIRLSDRLQGMPGYVLDYVLVHELAHLIEADHGPRFRELVAAYPHADRARGYLEGWSHARQQPVATDAGSAAAAVADQSSASGVDDSFDDVPVD
jgi:hypothetical protein